MYTSAILSKVIAKLVDPNFSLILMSTKASRDKARLLKISNRLSNLYIQQNEFEKACDIALKGLTATSTSGMMDEKPESYQLLEKGYRGLKQYQTALVYADSALLLKDSVFSSKMAAEITKMNVQFKTEQKDKEISLAKELQSIQQKRIHDQLIIILSLITLAVMLLIVAIVVYRSSLFRKRSKERIETIMGELNHRVKNNLQLISDMLELQMHMTTYPEHIAIIKAGLSRVQSMNLIHSQLYS